MMNVNESATPEPRALASVSVPYHILPLPSTTARSTSTRQPQTPSSSHGIGFTYAKDRINLLAPYMFTSASFGQRLQTSQRLVGRRLMHNKVMMHRHQFGRRCVRSISLCVTSGSSSSGSISSGQCLGSLSPSSLPSFRGNTTARKYFQCHDITHQHRRQQQHRHFFSTSAIPTNSNNTTARIFHYGNTTNDDDDDDDDERIIPSLSKLTARQSAELEDELISKLNNSMDDERLMDPILDQSLTRKGLDWVKSVSLPSKSASLSSSTLLPNNDNDDDDDSNNITVTIQPSTLIHPKLAEIASNLAQFVQEEIMVLLLEQSRSQWLVNDYLLTDNKQMTNDGNPDKYVGVTVKIIPPKSSSMTKQSTTTAATHGSGLSNKQKNEIMSNLGPGLQNVKHVIAVYSCKGGVGKSTIATNLAYQLASSTSGGYGRVGLLDLDVYGPSLPLLVQPTDPTVRQCPPHIGEGMIEPISHAGVKLMSLGYVSPNSGVPGSGSDPNNSPSAAVLRGPMAGRVVSQLLKGTNWGELDVLLLDLPPGTGDVQLTVCQSLSLSGAVAVSTPSNLAWADVMKGVSMFGELGVDTLALVENMAYFVCEGGGRHYPFGRAKSAMGGKKEEEEKVVVTGVQAGDE